MPASATAVDRIAHLARGRKALTWRSARNCPALIERDWLQQSIRDPFAFLPQMMPIIFSVARRYHKLKERHSFESDRISFAFLGRAQNSFGDRFDVRRIDRMRKP